MKLKTCLLIMCLASVLSACRKADKASFPYTAQVLAFAGVDAATDAASFKLTTKTFTMLRDLDDLNGDHLKITQGGELAIKQINGSLIDPGSFKSGRTPSLRYKVDDGVVISKDYATLVMLSAYFQFDTVFAELQQRLGISASDLFKGQSSEKFETLFEPKITLESDSASADAVIKLNAAFVPKDWQFILFRRSAVEHVPLAANLQVIAHEFGHSVFQRYVFESKWDDKDRFQQEYAMRGLNEGLADFISYTYTGSGDILRASMHFKNPDNGANIADYRSFKKYRFSFAEYLSTTVGDEKPKCDGEFYCIGSIFARGLYDTEEKLVAANTLSRDKFAPAVIAALPGILDEMKNQMIPDNAPVEASESKGEFDKWVISQFLNGFIKRMPVATQTALCETFTAETSFGSTGFPADFRRVCGAQP